MNTQRDLLKLLLSDEKLENLFVDRKKSDGTLVSANHQYECAASLMITLGYSILGDGTVYNESRIQYPITNLESQLNMEINNGP